MECKITIQSSTIRKINTTSADIIKSGKFLAMTCALVLGVYIYQMIGIGMGNVSLKTSWILSGDKGAYWFEYMRQTIQSIGSLAILIGITLIGREKKSFGPFNLAGNMLIMINGIITGLWFEAVVRFVMFTLYVFQFKNWDRRDKQGVEIGRANKKEWFGFITITLVFLAFALMFIFTPVSEEKKIAHILGMDLSAAPFDAIQGGLNIVGVWLIARRKTEGQFAFVISNMSALVMFMIVGQWVMVASTFTFLVVSFVAWLKWDTIFVLKSKTNFVYLWKFQK